MWIQTKGFNQGIATKIKNLCLGNVQSGFGIPGKYYSAWEAWQHTQQHTDPIPTGVDVPVFFSYTATIDGVNKNWGHIGVRLANGTFWSDGTIYPSIEAYQSNHSPRYVGWGESVNDVTVIKGGNMADKTNLNTARILAEEVLGRDRAATHAGKGDADLNAHHVNVDLSNGYIYNLWTSAESKAAAGARQKYQDFFNKYNSTIGELSSRPTKAQLDKAISDLNAEHAKVLEAEKKLADYNTGDNITITRNGFMGLFDKLRDFLKKG